LPPETTIPIDTVPTETTLDPAVTTVTTVTTVAP
jgi:hypothetical protein